jgi:DNA polymerase-4
MTIFHADLDAFYASAEQLDDPALIGRPVIVGGPLDSRSVVSACSYEARAFGVHSAMPINQAARLCPQAVIKPVRMARYQELSNRVMAIFADAAPLVRQISIDEAFLDMTGMERLAGPPETAARALKARILRETGLKVSIGIGPNRYVAKIASARSKPDGLLLVEADRVLDFLDGLPVTKLWGVGAKTGERLLSLGLNTVPRLRSLSREALAGAFGPAGGSFLYAAVRGEDPGIFSDQPASRSISLETTFDADIADPAAIAAVALEQALSLSFRLIAAGERARTVQIKLRYADFTTVSAQRSLRTAPSSAEEIRDIAMELFAEKGERGRPIRLFGIGLSKLEGAGAAGQGELFAGDDRKARVERAVFELKRKTGAQVTKARLVKPPNPKP